MSAKITLAVESINDMRRAVENVVICREIKIVRTLEHLGRILMNKCDMISATDATRNI